MGRYDEVITRYFPGLRMEIIRAFLYCREVLVEKSSVEYLDEEG
jgi:hypothetical protein